MLFLQNDVRQWPYFRDDLFTSNPSGMNYNPNQPQAINRFLRVLPLAGAAQYPVRLELTGCAVKELRITGPNWYDTGAGSAASAAIRPVSFSAAFCPSPIYSNTSGQTLQAPVPFGAIAPATVAGAPRVPGGGAAGYSGYISGEFLFESVDKLDPALLAQAPAKPSSAWLAAYQSPVKSVLTPFSGWTGGGVVYLPDYAAGQGKTSPSSEGYFLGSGARIARYSFYDTSTTPPGAFPQVVRKWYLFPFSQAPEAGGSFAVDPAAQMTFDDTLNFDEPTWVALCWDRGTDTNTNIAVTIAVSHQDHGA